MRLQVNSNGKFHSQLFFEYLPGFFSDEVHHMRPPQKFLLLLILATIITACVPTGPALNLTEFNEKLSGCFIADNYATPPCKVSQKVNLAGLPIKEQP